VTWGGFLDLGKPSEVLSHTKTDATPRVAQVTTPDPDHSQRLGSRSDRSHHEWLGAASLTWVSLPKTEVFRL